MVERHVHCVLREEDPFVDEEKNAPTVNEIADEREPVLSFRRSRTMSYQAEKWRPLVDRIV